MNVLLLKRVYTKCMYMCKAIFLYTGMFHLWIVKHVLCVGDGTGRRSTLLTLFMLWENGQIMCIQMSAHQCCITQGKKQCSWSLLQALFPYISIYCWLNQKHTMFVNFFFHYRRVCEAIAQEDVESKGKNMAKTVQNIQCFVPFYVILKSDFVYL